jgi:hypothetical protein
MRLVLDWNDATRELRMRLDAASRLWPPGGPRDFQVRLAGRTDTRPVRFDGSPVTVQLGEDR